VKSTTGCGTTYPQPVVLSHQSSVSQVAMIGGDAQQEEKKKKILALIVIPAA
jgi:hypothetical protein